MTINKYIYLLIFSLTIVACSKKTAMVDTTAQRSSTAVKESKQKVKNSVSQIPIDERVVMGTLENGMKYYIQKNAKPENRAELRLAVNAGSILEDEDQKGVAHFVEHMAFNGTTNFKKSELVDYLESVGTRFGPDLNAYTSFDETVYMLQVRTDSTQLFDKGMLILKDWASGVSFEHQEIDKERGVVVSEWRSRLSPDQRMQQVTFPIVYKGSQYAERLPIGDPETINTGDYAVFKRFYKDWYRPDLMAVVVVGDIDPAVVENQIKAQFGAIPASLNPRERKEFKVPAQPGTQIAIATDKEASFTNITINNKLPKQKMEGMADMRTSMLRSAYNGMLNARLEEIGKEADPPFVFSYTGYGSDVGDIDAYTSFALVPEGKASEGLKRLLLENNRVLQHGFTQGELDRQKKRMMERAERTFKEMDKTDSRQLSMRYVYNYLKGSPIPSPKQYLDIMAKELPSITLAEVNALPAAWISNENRVVTVTGPDKSSANIPTEQEVRSILAMIDTLQVEAYKDEVIEGPLLDKELTPSAIAMEEYDEATEVTKLVLENGATVYLKPTTYKNDEILLRASSEGGSSLYPDSTYFAATQAAGIVSSSGLADFSSVQMDKMMSGKTASVSPYIGTYYEGLNGSAAPKDVEEMFRMVYLFFTDIREDESSFESYINKQKGIYKNLKSNPNFYFSDYSSRLKFRNHPRVGFPSTRDFDKIEYSQVLSMYQDRFEDASDFVFTLVGNFSTEEMKDMVQKYIGNLPSTNREETWKDLEIITFPGKLEKRIKKGLAPKTQVEMFFHGELEYNPTKAYQLQSMLDYLRIKLREELREDKGGVYGVRVSGGANYMPSENYRITISFNSDPDKTDELINAAKDVIKQAKGAAPSEEDMTKVKETQRQGRIKSLEENRYWLSRINGQHFNKNDELSDILLPSLERKLSNLKGSNIRVAAATFLDFNNYTEIVMEPKPQPEN